MPSRLHTARSRPPQPAGERNEKKNITRKERNDHILWLIGVPHSHSFFGHAQLNSKSINKTHTQAHHTLIGHKKCEKCPAKFFFFLFKRLRIFSPIHSTMLPGIFFSPDKKKSFSHFIKKLKIKHHDGEERKHSSH